jgi:hypothetical protein
LMAKLSLAVWTVMVNDTSLILRLSGQQGRP